ncbi:MAG: flagellar filament capping protein FliD [Ignavibacteriales bacterium]
MATRITGLGSSGLDVDALVEAMMEAENKKRDKLIQKKQKTEWSRDAYRAINTSILALRTQTLNMKLTSSYKMYSTTSSDTSVLTASAGTAAKEGSYSITVDQLATTTQRKSTGTVSQEIQSSSDITNFDLRGKSFSLTYNGVTKAISWGASEVAYTDISTLQAGLQSKIDNAFGSNNVEVAASGNKIIFKPKDSTYKPDMSVTSAETNDALAQLNIASGTDYHINLDTKLEDVVLKSGALSFTAEGKLDFTINGETFQIEKSKTINDLITTVNASSTADATLSYDSTLDKFVLKRDASGEGVTLNVSDNNSTNFLSRLGLVDAGALTTGQNAVIDFTGANGITMTDLEMSSNNFTIQGINFNLLKADIGVQKTVTIAKDINTVYNNIKTFVDKYNEVLSQINTEYSEERDLDYQPLTEAERDEMSEEEIKKWEEKAKSGIIRSDTILNGLINDFRNTMSNPVTGLSGVLTTLSSIGITTGDYSEGGKLYIDETKLKAALGENLEQVTSLFTAAPANLESQALSGTIDLEGKDFNITVNGLKQNITLSGSYDLSSASGKTSFLSELQNKLNAAFGSNQVVASFSNNKLSIVSNKGYTIKLNSGTTNDALSTLGFDDGDTYDSSKKGVMAKLYDKLVIGGSKLTSKAGSSSSYYDTSVLGKELARIATSITNMNSRLADLEDRYYERFTAMEAAISRLNSQGTYITQQFSK